MNARFYQWDLDRMIRRPAIFVTLVESCLAVCSSCFQQRLTPVKYHCIVSENNVFHFENYCNSPITYLRLLSVLCHFYCFLILTRYDVWKSVQMYQTWQWCEEDDLHNKCFIGVWKSIEYQKVYCRLIKERSL